MTLAFAPLLAHARPGADLPEGTRPRGSYVVVPDHPVAIPTPTPQAGSHIVFLNRCPGGISIHQGGSDSSKTNTSSIVNGTINLPEYPFGDAAWNEVVAGAREIFSPFGITVTDVDPTPADHDEVIVCGSDSAAGFPGAAGVAPFTCGYIPNAITFVFPDTIGNDARFTIETIGQEAAHGWGLDHEFECTDPMTYLNGCGDKSFQDGDYPCGEYEARACMCGGNTQNSFQHILGLFGPGTPDGVAPSVAIVQPTDGQSFVTGSDFQITISVSDDAEVASVTLHADGVPAGTDDSAPFTGWPATDIPAGDHEFYVEAVDQAGNLGTSDVVTIHVSDDGAPPPGGSGGGSDDGGAAGSGEGGDGGLDDGGADGSPQGNDALPPGFGLDDTQQGCACTAEHAPTWSGAPLLAILVLAARRRRAAD